MLISFRLLTKYYRSFESRELLKGESEGLLKLPTDIALLDDPEFRQYVELYAKVKKLIQLDDLSFLWSKCFKFAKLGQF